MPWFHLFISRYVSFRALLELVVLSLPFLTILFHSTWFQSVSRANGKIERTQIPISNECTYTNKFMIMRFFDSKASLLFSFYTFFLFSHLLVIYFILNLKYDQTRWYDFVSIHCECKIKIEKYNPPKSKNVQDRQKKKSFER